MPLARKGHKGLIFYLDKMCGKTVFTMKYIATTTFMANGATIQRGTILDGKDVCKWLNYQLLEVGGYIRRIETPGKE
jgi:hypothetical protein